MGYDTGLKVGEHACTVPDCTADHKQGHQDIRGDVGYYAPIKKQTDVVTCYDHSCWFW